MERRVERNLIDRWIDEHGPDGLLRLAERSGVSSSTITKARLGYVPRKKCTRNRLCEAMRVSEERLFPSVGAVGNKSAS
jgi:transcriptional regulator with XRE-family HTH domain